MTGGKTSMHLAAEGGRHTASTGYLEVLKWLKEQRADINARDAGGQTPLDYATRGSGRDENPNQNTVIQWLKNNGARNGQDIGPAPPNRSRGAQSSEVVPLAVAEIQGGTIIQAGNTTIKMNNEMVQIGGAPLPVYFIPIYSGLSQSSSLTTINDSLFVKLQGRGDYATILLYYRAQMPRYGWKEVTNNIKKSEGREELLFEQKGQQIRVTVSRSDNVGQVRVDIAYQIGKETTGAGSPSRSVPVIPPSPSIPTLSRSQNPPPPPPMPEKIPTSPYSPVAPPRSISPSPGNPSKASERRKAAEKQWDEEKARLSKAQKSLRAATVEREKAEKKQEDAKAALVVNREAARI